MGYVFRRKISLSLLEELCNAKDAYAGDQSHLVHNSWLVEGQGGKWNLGLSGNPCLCRCSLRADGKTDRAQKRDAAR